MKILGETLVSLIAACSVQGLPSDLVEGIVRTESAGYVYAVSGSYDYSAYHLLPNSQSEIDYAVAVSKASLEHNVNISVGLMQVNSWHLMRMGASVETAFDACNNILFGTAIFKEITNRVCGSEFTDECINAALRQYNTGKIEQSKAGDLYVSKVRQNMSLNVNTSFSLPSSRSTSPALTSSVLAN